MPFKAHQLQGKRQLSDSKELDNIMGHSTVTSSCKLTSTLDRQNLLQPFVLLIEKNREKEGEGKGTEDMLSTDAFSHCYYLPIISTHGNI